MEIITEAEQATIIQWANDNYTTFTKNGQGRQFLVLSTATNAPPCISDIKQRIVEKENLEYAEQESDFGDYVSYIQNGGQINKHKIPEIGGKSLIRFEVYVQLPLNGGMPLIDDKVEIVTERHYARRKPDADFHSCQIVEGMKNRIVLSFGFLLPRGV